MNTEQTQPNGHMAGVTLSDDVRRMPLFDFRPREFCLGSWGYGFFIGGLVAYGTLGVLSMSVGYLLGAAISALLAKLVHASLPLRA